MGLPENGKQNGGDDGRADQGSRASRHQDSKGVFSVDALDVGGGLVLLVFSGVFHVAGGWFHIAGFFFDFLVVLCGLTIITHHVDKRHFRLFGLRYWLALIVTFGIFSALAVHVVLKENTHPLPANATELKPAENDPFRPLVPANDPFPNTPDGKPIDWVATNAVLFFFGNCLLANPVNDTQPKTIVFGREEVSGKFEFRPMIGIAVEPAGAAVFGRFFDKNGKIVAVFRDNKPIINENNAFDVQRPDASTLIVHDQYDNEVLNIKYMRPRVFRFTGLFYAPDGGWANVSQSNIVISAKFGSSTIAKMTLENMALFIGVEDGGFGGSAPYISN